MIPCLPEVVGFVDASKDRILGPGLGVCKLLLLSSTDCVLILYTVVGRKFQSFGRQETQKTLMFLPPTKYVSKHLVRCHTLPVAEDFNHQGWHCWIREWKREEGRILPPRW